MFDFLYGVIISPIEFVLGIFYFVLYRVFSSEGFAIVGLSVVVTLLVLPLYNMADAWQDEEREKQRRMKGKLDEIKAAFHGDERHMIINTYYRQQHYHPLMQLRSVIGVAIQVPFFIAAYHYLSHLTVLNGVSFLFLNDLSKPDGLLKIGNFHVNIMPILMTVINLMSAAVYGKKLTGKEITQLVIMALLFLVLLYPSPSGLVLYWTMNNLFSLIKNIFHRTANPGRNFRLMIVGVFWGLFLFCIYTLIPQISNLFPFIKTNFTIQKRFVLCVIFAALTLTAYFLPQLFEKAKTYGIFDKKLRDETHKDWNMLLILSCTILVILTGLTVPLSLIASSPLEFVNLLSEKSSPLNLIKIVFPQALGLTMFYPLMIYCLFKERVKYPLMLIWLAAAVCATINIFAFPANYGVILPNLKFEKPLTIEMIGENKQFLNLLVLYLACVGVFLLLYFKKQKWISSCLAICVIAATLMSLQNVVKINKEYKEFLAVGDNNGKSADKIEPFFNFSKTKQNVVVIMLDRAINSYFEEVLKYDPTLKERMSGFTYYPNTVSFAGHTLMGVPGLWGGYEYTPQEMNRRDDVALVDKHSEALKMLPVLFKNTGCDVAFSDPSWSGYKFIPDTSILTKAGIRCENFQQRYIQEYNKKFLKNSKDTVSDIKSNLIRFSLLKESLLVTRIFFYNNGNYLDMNQLNDENFDDFFLGNYALLDYLPELCSFDSNVGGVMLLEDQLTHCDQEVEKTNYFFDILNKNKFRLSDNYKFPYQQFYFAEKTFPLNVLSIELLAKWFEKLKSENVYDNTKIIIVSDHGFPVKTKNFTDFPKLVAHPVLKPDGENSNEYAYFNPLLLVKDFNAAGEIKTSYEFMTNADVPTIAVSHLPENLRKNPFTEKNISSKEKAAGVNICTSMKFRPSDHEKYKFDIGNDEVFHVKNNIFDAKNWTPVSYQE